MTASLTALVAFAPLLSPAPQLARLRQPQHGPAFRTPLVIDHPCPAVGANFGESTVALDLLGDDELEIAVGAFGQGVVFVMIGASDTRVDPAFTRYRAFDEGGLTSCPITPAGNRLGYDVAGGEFDGDAHDELVAGAPYAEVGGVALAGAVYLYGIGPVLNAPVVLTADVPEPERLGNSVITGDFNDDGFLDVAAAAPKALIGGSEAGRVRIFFGPFDSMPIAQISIDNPEPVVNGNFGQHLSVGDSNGDGIDDLYVSAIGNTASGIPLAGQIFYYPGPISDVVYQAIEDNTPDPTDLPSPRYGMTIDARGPLLGIGANRKDLFGVMDTGQGFVYSGPGLPLVSTHAHPNPQALDFMAFRVVFANVVGDASPDATFVAMPNRNLPDPNPYALFIWDGDDLNGAPRTVPVIAGSGDHWGNGISYAQVIPDGYEELIVGDPTWDAPAAPNNDETGRVVIYANL